MLYYFHYFHIVIIQSANLNGACGPLANYGFVNVCICSTTSHSIMHSEKPESHMDETIEYGSGTKLSMRGDV